jgi:aminopeptidase N
VEGFALPEHADLLAPYAERYFEVIGEIWASRGEHFRMLLARALFPHAAASPELLARVDEFLAAPGLDAGLARVVTEDSQMTERALRARALP